MTDRQRDFVSQSFDAARTMGGAFDMRALADTQRRNVDAVLAANRVLAEGFQHLLLRHSEIVRESLQNASQVMRDITETANEKPDARPTEYAKRAIDAGFGYARELSEIIVRTNADAFRVLRDRMISELDEASEQAGHVAEQVKEGAQKATDAAQSGTEAAGHQAQQTAASAAEAFKKRNNPRDGKPEQRIEGLGGQA